MYEEERKISILNKIQTERNVAVSKLAKQFGVSESTIRRDLSSLETSGFIKRTHGGAILQGEANKTYFYNQKRYLNTEDKKEIAQTAASIVKPNSTIFLGTSTSTYFMAQYLTAKNLTIATNSLDVLNILSQHTGYNLIVLGGNYIRSARTIEGFTGIEQISHLHFQQAFLGANGVDLSFGLSTSSDIEAKSKLSVTLNSSEVYYLCETSKFNQISSHKISDFESVTGIITNKSISPAVFKKYESVCKIIY